METTFGRTVETRFINANTPMSVENHLNPPLFNTHNNISSSSKNFNSLRSSHLKRQQQLQHIYLNSYRECNAPSSQLTLHDATFLRPSIQVAPSSAILTRKKFKHLANVPSSNGYSSDGDYCNTDNLLSSRKQINAPEFKFKRLNSTISHNYTSDYEESGRYGEQNETNDNIISGLNTTDRENDIKLMRYKSIERQHANYVREHKSFQEKKKLEQNKIDSYRYQYLNERLNEQINSRLTDLLSPKITPSETSNLNQVKNLDTFNNYNERIQYLLNKNNMRLQNQRLNSLNLNSQSNTISRQEKSAVNGNNLNLVNYLTWKNCGNIYPSTISSTVKQNEKITTSIEPNNLEENVDNSLNHNWLKESSRVHSKSISTPSTPQLCTLPRYSRLDGSIAVNTKTTKKQSNIFLNHEKFIENYNKKKELPFEFKDKLNLKNDCIQSSNSQVRFQFHPNLEIPATRHHQPTRSKSVSNNPEFSRNSSKSQLEVVPLENALLNMNEILKNLTLNFQKKLNENNLENTISNTNINNNYDMETKTNDLSLSPENLTSDSSRLLHESSFENCIANLSPSSSKSSSSSSYSNSSKSSNIIAVENGLTQTLETQTKQDQCQKSFSQSSSMNSCSSSVSERSDPCIVLSASSEARSSTSPFSTILASSNLPLITSNPSSNFERKIDSIQTKQTESNTADKKKQTLSFGKKLKQFLSFNSNNSKRKYDLNGILK